ncbi:SMP-30/gluconolactonase/LRE family protein [Altererythrobacter sp. ZODW24]|uniref:SMP-30/gluconolactonase/LRE family protein n=1 Tax=Altererythrobacter sp. ZODW24 TaxID=2185142 RepID=UPI000DF7257B|nr:SMP-30/gluconolactonase/LRE family protein [Altererythrobacter sp. ZODW24]
MKLPVRQVVDSQAVLGEGPVWDAERGIVWFVDIKQHLLWLYDPASGAQGSVKAPCQIGWVLPASDGTLLAGMQDGLYSFEPDTGLFTKQCSVAGEPSSNRLNDGCTDPAGRAWFGSMDDNEKEPAGRFYRFERGVIEPAGPDNICITNGPAVSPDGKLIYFTDTLSRRIMVCDIAADGSVGEQRTFTNVGIPGAYPDGPVIDSEGYLWTGLWNGWCVARYSPAGELVEQVPIPAANVTKLAFGGEDLKTVFVTTARKGLSDEALEEQPLAGSLFAFDSPVAGAVTSPVRLTP